MFQGKRKYYTLGAIVLVILLALYVNRKRSSGGGVSTYGLDPNSIAPGAGAPGLTMADVQGAIDKYGEKDAENTQKMFDQLSGSFTDALTKQAESQADLWNKMVESNKNQFDAIGKQFEGINNSLTQINDNNAKMQESLWAQMQSSLAAMQSQFANRYQSYNTPDPYYGGGSTSYGDSGGSSSSSGSSSLPLYQNQNAYDQRENVPKDSVIGKVIESNRDKVEDFANHMNNNATWSPSNPLFKA